MYYFPSVRVTSLAALKYILYNKTVKNCYSYYIHVILSVTTIDTDNTMRKIK